MRGEPMRIAESKLVTKNDCYPIEAADLFAYLIATVLNPDASIFDGVLGLADTWKAPWRFRAGAKTT
jgi:hypothetical protein